MRKKKKRSSGLMERQKNAQETVVEGSEAIGLGESEVIISQTRWL